MNILLNGETKQISAGCTVHELLCQISCDPNRVAVELNLIVVPREQFSHTLLQENDQVEVVHFIGGGSPL